MSRNSKRSLFNKLKNEIVLFIVVLVWSLATGFSLLEKFDLRLYDIMLSTKKAPSQSDEILFVEIDNAALETLGQWPWTRDVIADNLLRMKELGADLALFDIEYLSPSSFGVNPDAQYSLDDAFTEQKNEFSDLVNQLAGAATSGNYSNREVLNLSKQIVSEYINPGLDNLLQTVEDNVYRDNDAYFSSALQFFGNSWLTINTSDIEIKIDEDFENYVSERCLYGNVNDEGDLIRKGNLATSKEQLSVLGFTPALKTFLQSARGAGFTNVVIDNDGTRRRVELLFNHKDRYIAQLAFSPVLNILKPKEIIRTRNSLILKGVLDVKNTKKNLYIDDDNELRRDIVIPLDSKGRMLLNWQHKSFVDSFRHESFLFLDELGEIEKNIVDMLRSLSSFNLKSEKGWELSYSKEVWGLLEKYAEILQAKNYLLSMCLGYDADNVAIGGGIDEDSYSTYFALRKAFFESVKDFCNGESLAEIENRLNQLKRTIGEDQYEEYSAGLSEIYDAIAHENEMYLSNFAEMEKTFKGSFCIIGNTASSTSDLGTTPFERAYPNVGTHANVYNTIMSENFIRPISWIWSVVFVIILALIYLRLTRNKNAFNQNFFGILMILLVVASHFVLFCFFGIYSPMLTSSLIAITFYIAIIIVRFLSSEKDKGTLRRAFSTYVAPVIVEQIVKDPSKLKLGGDEKHITALFTDIKSFSSFSELVTPTTLVSILNEYLGAMSDEILNMGGTIDKYIGDAIVSFFGAPLEMKDHAWNACIAAIKMKQIETKFNEEHLKDGSIPRELQTRIGINTGNMVAGNMGTSAKMNYTIMGNDVNLASRLEGVNKTYHSWILCSEQTWLEADKGEHKGLLLGRKFDKVRVVGIEKPVQLYNILGLKSELPKELIESVDIFHEALELYLKKDFVKAGKLFMAANKKYPSDESALVFASRCKDYIKNGVPENWDGVVNMLTK